MINDLLVMCVTNREKRAGPRSETMKANQLWGEVLDNAADREQMGEVVNGKFPSAGAVAALWQQTRWKALEILFMGRQNLRYSHTRL